MSRLLGRIVVLRSDVVEAFFSRGEVEAVSLKPNSITLASSGLAPNMFGASSELVRS